MCRMFGLSIGSTLSWGSMLSFRIIRDLWLSCMASILLSEQFFYVIFLLSYYLVFIIHLYISSISVSLITDLQF